jgi:photosystem II stability/assembly factor-like uncharacterized protein
VTLDPRRPDTIWVGTGESNNQRSVSWGDGVYRSDDGGRTWRNMGLKTSEHIGRIVIDPRNSNVVYVAAQGPLWSAGGERGLYRTNDGGQTWRQALKISDDTGVSDVVLDPSNPDVVLAAAHQRRRHVWTMIHGGPESALYKSNDGGRTFRKVTIAGGELGRIGLNFSPAQKGLVYASVEGGEGASGTYRSTNSGESWEKRSDTVAQSMYYAKIIPDPNFAERVYLMDVQVQTSDDGGRTWHNVGERSKHVDNHDYWIDPKNSNHILAGCDGGLYESWDRGQLWRFMANLPVTQFYNVDVDNAAPIYNVYGGTQDNSTLGGPSRTRGVNGAQNADWFIVTGGDGFVARIDPQDPNWVYGESQYGGLVRLNRKTGERTSIKPVEGKGEAPLRFNWESPFIISPHSNTRLYFGASRLLRSDDRGGTWTPVSPDLTRQADRNLLPVMGKIWAPEAIAKHQSTDTWGNITAVSESRKKEGLLYVGTDDGLIQVSEDGGKNWRKIDKIAGLPDLSKTGPIGVYVQRLYASKHDVNTVYALFDNHKNGDFKPYLMKSADKGATWISIAGDLTANGPVLALAEDHVNPNLLFCGTEFGLYFTLDGGKKWIRLRNGLPTIAVRDLAIQERENDLVLATFGRGFYVLDDYAPLRGLNAETLNKAAGILPVRTATIYAQDTGRNRGSQGQQLWFGENLPYGATITYWVKDVPRGLRGDRLEKQREAERKKETITYPTPAQLTAEADEEAPQVILIVTDGAGKLVRRLAVPGGRGLQRFTWNLRAPAATAGGGFGGRGGRGGGGGAAAMDEETSAMMALYSGGEFVAPGTYKASLALRASGKTTPLGAEQSFKVEGDAEMQTAAAGRAAKAAFAAKVTKLQQAVAGLGDAITGMRTRTAASRRAILDSTADFKLLDEAAALDKRALVLQRQLRGDETLRGLESGAPATVQSRTQSAASGARSPLSPPTGTQQLNLKIATEEAAEMLPKVRQLEAELKKFEQRLDAAGVPYTAGRMPDIK